ncbi:glycosyltransferase [Vacuolonema iberomarrocanum]|uniref:glycosyltransferase n=1 Tax=Vacuolonema iberomarrocanum TaxID=3454632 RepID=UPI0019EC864A|nr:glycosyltransferase [filamentous cyanobacterium LEGE 07170]
MTHFGILCLGATGHLNTMFPLGRELQRRGHPVTLFTASEVQSKVEAAGFDFYDVYSQVDEARQKQQPQAEEVGLFVNLKNIRYTLTLFAHHAETRLQKAPSAIRERGVDALIVDLSVFEGGTIADSLGLPYVTMCCMLPFYQDPAIPPIPTAWQYESAWWAQFRNRMAYSVVNVMAQPVLNVISRYRRKRDLPAYSHPNDVFSKLAIITRHIPEFEFPRQLPPHFHFTGSFHQAIAREPIAFPFEQLNDKPLIYASMGTVQNRFGDVFQTIAAACADLNAQLVISLGGRLEPELFSDLPGNPLVVKYAPQLELLQRASLNITHAGLNTTLESLSYGVPMVAIPVTDDQPGVAARIVWTGAGELVKLSQLTVSNLRGAIERVLTEDTYKQNAVRLQARLHQTRGVSHAVDIIEQAISTSRPVTCVEP